MVHFVGAGPGAPDLITLRGAALLERADQVIYAGSLVNPKLLDRCRADCRILNSAVMTLEEVRGSLKQPIWKEVRSSHKDLYMGWVLAYDIQAGQGITGTRLGMADPSGRMAWYRLEDYGTKWRCWTSRPTDKQREAVKWE